MHGYDSFSPITWLIVIGYVALVGFPIAKILRRTGNSGWWTMLAFIPFLNLIALWIFAFARWPRDAQQS